MLSIKEYGLLQSAVKWATGSTFWNTVIPIAFTMGMAILGRFWYDNGGIILGTACLLCGSVFILHTVVNLIHTYWESSDRPYRRLRKVPFSNYSVKDIRAFLAKYPEWSPESFKTVRGFHRTVRRELKDPIYSRFKPEELVEIYEVLFAYPLEDLPTVEPGTTRGKTAWLWRVETGK